MPLPARGARGQGPTALQDLLLLMSSWALAAVAQLVQLALS